MFFILATEGVRIVPEIVFFLLRVFSNVYGGESSQGELIWVGMGQVVMGPGSWYTVVGGWSC